MFRYQNRLFVTIGWKIIIIISHYNLYYESIVTAILDCKVSTNGILGDVWDVGRGACASGGTGGISGSE